MLLLTSFNHNVGDINNDINILLTIINGYCRYLLAKVGLVYDSGTKDKIAKHSHRFCICQMCMHRDADSGRKGSDIVVRMGQSGSYRVQN